MKKITLQLAILLFTIGSFYVYNLAHAAVPTFVQGTSTEAGAVASSTVTLTVTSGHIITWFAATINGSVHLNGSDNCGGTYTTTASTTNSADTVAEGYGTGASGTCKISIVETGGTADNITTVIHEITAGTYDTSTLKYPFTPPANGTSSANLTTAGAAYIFTAAVFADGAGGTISTSSPMTVVQRETNAIFPIKSADATTTSSGSATTTWKFSAADTHSAIGMMDFIATAVAGGASNATSQTMTASIFNVGNAAFQVANSTIQIQ